MRNHDRWRVEAVGADGSLTLAHLERPDRARLPESYVARDVEPIAGGGVLEGEVVRLGEAWRDGVAVLSWAEVQSMARGQTPGQNLILHEFAHILDMEDGASDGTPILADRGQYAAWSAVMEDEYERLRRLDHLGRYSVLDLYGATNPAEFFAVATEAFFEKPTVLKRRHPELYDVLNLFYRQDPAEGG